MERTRIPKVEGVKLVRRGQQVEGTLHLTPHHLIFCHTPEPDRAAPSSGKSAHTKPKELWITYPIIQTCTLRPSHPSSRQPSSIRLRCRDFTFVCFCLYDEKKARDVYDSIKAWTCKIGRIEKLYAFSYQPQKPEKEVNGWEHYDAKQEWRRLGISEKGADRGWRISKINTDYAFSSTYPALLPVPSSMSDNTLNYAGKFRSRVRLPVLTYLHSVNNCSITRCSQPLVGVRQNRSIQDEKLLLAIFSTTQSHNIPNESSSSTPPGNQTPRSSQGDVPSFTPETSFGDTEALEDELIASASSQERDEGPRIYGAQQHNLIVDARPTVNAIAMQAVGMGSENMDNYPFATKAYLGIDNIHVMRDSLNRVIDTLKESDLTPLGPNREALAKTGWLKHIANMLDGVGLIARQVGIQHSHVVIHCSDGWDRTSQLSALSQLCLDPYYRTLDGFIVLVEKDWLSFGHMFATRAGFLSSEKWFHIENERIGGSDNNRAASSATSGNNALENAFLSAKGFFNKDNKSRDSLIDSDSELNPMDEAAAARKAANGSKTSSTEKHVTKVKETSPMFHQFLDATYQLLTQHPSRFEFNERFLRRLLYHLYSCQYGTFLFNSEKQRREAKIHERTRSVWDYFLARREQFLNPTYNPTVDDNQRGQERLIFPKAGSVKWWAEVFGRTDAEMNGPPPAAQSAPDVGQRTTMSLTGVETAEAAVGPGASSALGGGGAGSDASGSGTKSPARGAGAVQGGLDALSRGVGALGIGKSSVSPARRSEDEGMREMREMGAREMEVEMQ